MQALYDNKFLSATVTASSEATVVYPLSNLQDTRLIRRWRSTGGTAEWVKAAGSLKATRLAIAGHKLSSSAVIRVQADTMDDFSDPLLNEVVSWSAGTIVHEIEDVARDKITNIVSGSSGIFFGAAYGNGVWVAVGASGNIQSSTDKVTWVTRTPDNGFSGDFFDVCFGMGVFWAVGAGAEIQSSPDGETWTEINATSGISDLNAVTYADGYFVAVGKTIVSSVDGSTLVFWYNATPDWLTDIAFGNNLWVGPSPYGSKIYTFTTAQVLAQSGYQYYATSYVYHCMTYGMGLFVGGSEQGKIITSSDGITFHEASSSYGGDVRTIIYGNNIFVAGGAQTTIQTSLDGYNWTLKYMGSGGSGDVYVGIAYAANAFVLCGAQTNSVFYYAHDSTFPYWRVLIDDPVTGYVEIGLIYLGEALTLPGANVPAQFTDETNSAFSNSISMQLYGDKRTDYLSAVFSFSDVTNDEWVSVKAFADTVGTIYPFILEVWENSLDVQEAIYCHLKKKPQRTIDDNRNGLTWSFSLEIIEVK